MMVSTTISALWASWRSCPLQAISLLLIVLTGCGGDLGRGSERLILASTTSTEDSGLFGEILPAFGAAHPEYRVVVIAVGTGEALAMGERGDADVLLVHAPSAESLFVANGHGTERREVMYNDFVIVGPESDQAGIAGLDAIGAFSRISARGAPFVSRGDDSGTHKRELALWARAGVAPGGSWYTSAGQGMGEILRIASERRAYTLTDRATYLFLRDGLELEILVEGDERLLNIYGVIPVSGSPKLDGARLFMEWITGVDAQGLIGGYGVDRFGEPLFIPSAH